MRENRPRREHFTRRTVEAKAWCVRCAKSTMHRIDKGFVGPCIPCLQRREQEARELAEKRAAQHNLFGEGT